MSPSRRAQKWPIHDALTMVWGAEWIIRDLYPQAPKTDVRDLAIYFVVYVTKGRVKAKQLRNMLERSSRNRRVIVPPLFNPVRRTRRGNCG